MLKFVKLFNDFKDYFVFIILVIICLSLISINSTPEIGGFRAVVVAGVGYIQSFFSWIPNPNALENENRTLIELNLQLSTEVAMTRKALQENNELRNMLNLIPNSSYELIPCDVLSKNTIQMRNFAVIGKGYNDDIEVGMSVRSEAGLVGNIVGVSANFSMVELLNNRNVKIPAILSKSQLEGVVIWEGDKYLYLNNIYNYETVEVGEIVSTSITGNRFPRNVPIGKVVKVVNEGGSHFKKIYIQPASNFTKFTQLFVIKYVPNREEIELIKDIENKILAFERKRK